MIDQRHLCVRPTSTRQGGVGCCMRENKSPACGKKLPSSGVMLLSGPADV